MKKRQWRKWYPRSWRARYGEEYAQLLEDLTTEHRLSWRGELDVMRSGLSLRRIYPDGRRRVALGIGSGIILAGLGFGLGFGIRGTESSTSFSIVAPFNRVAIGRCN